MFGSSSTTNLVDNRPPELGALALLAKRLGHDLISLHWSDDAVVAQTGKLVCLLEHLANFHGQVLLDTPPFDTGNEIVITRGLAVA